MYSLKLIVFDGGTDNKWNAAVCMITQTLSAASDRTILLAGYLPVYFFASFIPKARRVFWGGWDVRVSGLLIPKCSQNRQLSFANKRRKGPPKPEARSFAVTPNY